MGNMTTGETYRTIQVGIDQDICRIRIHRPNDNNTINGTLIEEIARVVAHCEEHAKIVILEGSPEIFCLGADFPEICRSADLDERRSAHDPEPLYELWKRLACGPFISIAHVRGKVNAGGIGFVAACDLVLSEDKAVFSLSEMLFGLLPALVLPFLVRRVGFTRANYMTLTTQTVSARQAIEWGLVDACEENSENLLRKHLVRLRRLTKPAISRYKRYTDHLDTTIMHARPEALRANTAAFTDSRNLENIVRFVRTGQFPWESRS
jgi:polyketide biosynthesis enoyl-CoA hydratase PksH